MNRMAYIYRAPSGASFETREQLDAEYDVETHPKFLSYVENFVTWSENARAEYRNDLSVPYGPSSAETLDIFPGEPGGPVVLFIHGGYWKALTSVEHSFVAPGFVQNGATVVIPTYGLCPEVTIDEIVRQMRSVVKWIHENANEYGYDPEQLVITGHSAGGHLVARLLETDWASFGFEAQPIAGACGISGLYDLRPLRYTSMQPDLRFTADEILRNSPIFNPPVEAPKLLLTYGAGQPSEFARQTVDFYEAWKAVGLDVEQWARPDLNHFDELDAFLDPQSDLVQNILNLKTNK